MTERRITGSYGETLGKPLYKASHDEMLVATAKIKLELTDRASQEAEDLANRVAKKGKKALNGIQNRMETVQGSVPSMDQIYAIGEKAQKRSEKSAIAAFARWHREDITYGYVTEEALNQLKEKNPFLYELLNNYNFDKTKETKTPENVIQFKKPHKDDQAKDRSLTVHDTKETGVRSKVGRAVAAAAIITMAGTGLSIFTRKDSASARTIDSNPTVTGQDHQTTPTSGEPKNGKSTPKPQGNRGNGVGVPGGPIGNPTETGNSQGDQRGAPGNPGNNHANPEGCIHGEPDCNTPQPTSILPTATEVKATPTKAHGTPTGEATPTPEATNTTVATTTATPITIETPTETVVATFTPTAGPSETAIPTATSTSVSSTETPVPATSTPAPSSGRLQGPSNPENPSFPSLPIVTAPAPAPVVIEHVSSPSKPKSLPKSGEIPLEIPLDSGVAAIVTGLGLRGKELFGKTQQLKTKISNKFSQSK